MDQELDIVVTGFDVAESQAARGLSQAFDLSPDQAQRFVRDVPRIAKRRASREEAERFAEALRAIGARVETLPSAAPRPTLPTRMAKHDEPAFSHDPWSTDPPPADGEAMRFRATGSLGMLSLHPEDVLNPSIPKAPLIPRDMHRMPNAELALPSLRPEEPGADPTLDPLHRHTDAQLPPPLVFVNTETPSMDPAEPSAARASDEAQIKPRVEQVVPRIVPEVTADAAKPASGPRSVLLAALLFAVLAAFAVWLVTRP